MNYPQRCREQTIAYMEAFRKYKQQGAYIHSVYTVLSVLVLSECVCLSLFQVGVGSILVDNLGRLKKQRLLRQLRLKAAQKTVRPDPRPLAAPDQFNFPFFWLCRF